MRKIKDVLRLKYEAKLSGRQIAASLKLSVGVISKYIKVAEAAELYWPLPDGMDGYSGPSFQDNRLSCALS